MEEAVCAEMCSSVENRPSPGWSFLERAILLRGEIDAQRRAARRRRRHFLVRKSTQLVELRRLVKFQLMRTRSQKVTTILSLRLFQEKIFHDFFGGL